jgi:hypothetical protein
MQLVAWYFRLKDERLFKLFFLYKRCKRLVGGEDEEHSLAQSLTHSLIRSFIHSLTLSIGSFSIPNKHKLPRWILMTLEGADIFSLGNNLQLNIAISNLKGS